MHENHKRVRDEQKEEQKEGWTNKRTEYKKLIPIFPQLRLRGDNKIYIH